MGTALASLMLGAAVGGGTPVTPAAASIAPEEIGGLVATYHIPPGSMSSALNDLADSVGMHVAFEARLAQGLRTKGLTGRHSLREALDRLLAGTDLIYRFADNRRTVLITLAQNDTTRNDASGAEALPPIDVGAQQTRARGAAGLGSGGATGYVTPTTSTATKMDIPNLQLPASVKVVPHEVLKDQVVTNIKDALENVSSVQTAQSQSGSQVFNRIRGFLTPRMFRNGLLAVSPGNLLDIGTSNIERVEVMKGPDSMLYGRSDPGGLINIVTKRPVDAPIHTIQQRFGQFSQYFTEWDIADSATEDKSVLYRVSGGYLNSGGFRDFSHTDRVHVNPSVTWRPTQDTSFTADVEYYNQDFTQNLGITIDPSNPTRPANIPISRNHVGPNAPLSNNRNLYVGSELTHRFNDSFTLKHRFLASFLHHDDAYSSNADVDSAGNVLRLPFSQQNDSEVYGTNLDLLGHFDIADTHHDTLIGFDYQHIYAAYGNQGRFYPPDPAFTVNMYDPWASAVYTSIPTSFYEWQRVYDRPRYLNDRQVNLLDQEGLYFQDHVSLLDGKLHILGGGRFDWLWQGQARGSSAEAAESYIYSHPVTINPAAVGDPLSAANRQYSFLAPTRSDTAFSPRVGLLFQPVPWASVYGSWTQAFTPNISASAGVDNFNRPFAPGKSEQVEVGAKAEWFDGRLTTTVALFELEKKNIPVRDIASLDPTALLLVGAARSKGVEFDASGKILDNMSLISSFTYMDARVTKDTNTDPATTTQGRRLMGVPRYQGSFWAKWDVREITALDGLSLGFGVFVVGNRQGDDQSSFQLPGYVRLDAMAAYKWKVMGQTVTAQLNLRNLANTRYYESSDSNFSTPKYAIYPGAPFTAVGTIKLEF
ncbi:MULTISPECIES: TonB-dependent siderophore receptor [Methylosinus]|nr:MULTISPECIES: TonB-dependent receptor [Methylosinus]